MSYVVQIWFTDNEALPTCWLEKAGKMEYKGMPYWLPDGQPVYRWSVRARARGATSPLTTISRLASGATASKSRLSAAPVRSSSRSH